jgi:uncharacterized protein YidB (DUF937 family)
MGLLGQLAGGLLGGGGGGNLANVLFGMIQNQPGGLGGLVQAFQNKGLGDIVNSWVGTGQNMPISPDQVHSALGANTINDIASKLGVSPQVATSGLSQLLPQMIDKLTPTGQVPDHSSILSTGMSVIQSLLK